MAKEAILYLTHKINKWIIREFKNVKRTSGNRQVVLLYNGQYNNNLPSPNFCFTKNDLWNLGYPAMSSNLIPGQSHLPLFKYFKEHEKADYYWVMEYDVRFTGRWRFLFDYFKNSNADLISSLIRNYSDHTNWDWWELSHPTNKINKKDRIASFNPIYRISKPGLYHLDKNFRSGWKGHQEVIIPTLLKQHGFEIEDFGGSGKYVRGKKNKFYTNFSIIDHLYHFGTFRYRPERANAGLRKNKLYHPVKPQSKAGLLRNLRYFKYRLHKRYGSSNKS